MAPMAATAAELNINGVSDYSGTSEKFRASLNSQTSTQLIGLIRR